MLYIALIKDYTSLFDVRKMNSTNFLMKRILSAVCIALVFSICGCTSAGGGKPLSDITFQHIEQISPSVAEVSLADHTAAYPDIYDVSSVLPETPQNLVRKFVERIVPAGDLGTLKVILVKAYTHASIIDPGNGLGSFLELTTKDRYDIFLKVRLSYLDERGIEIKGSVLTFNRMVTVPQSYSLAKRDRVLLGALEKLSADISDTITRSLKDTLNLI